MRLLAVYFITAWLEDELPGIEAACCSTWKYFVALFCLRHGLCRGTEFPV